jgi:hypothetical protein
LSYKELFRRKHQLQATLLAQQGQTLDHKDRVAVDQQILCSKEGVKKTVQDRRQTLNVQYSNIESNPRRCGINLKAQYGCEQTLKSSIKGEFGRPEMMKETCCSTHSCSLVFLKAASHSQLNHLHRQQLTTQG